MTSWVQSKYISLLSYRLRNFKKKSENLYNFSCPDKPFGCGDSENNPKRARAYFFSDNEGFRFHCHNCSKDRRFETFLKEFDPNLYQDYLFDKLGNKGRPRATPPKAKKKSNYEQQFDKLLKIKDLKNSHPAKKYLIDRKIPVKYIDELYFCEEFKAWTNSQIKDKFNDISIDDERVIIPFRDQSNNLIGYQGRLLYNSPVKYITILYDESFPKVFNLNKVDFNYTYYVFEGPFDSMFVHNAIATAGGKISSELSKLNCNRSNAVVVHDNEPRNKEIIHSIRSAISSNYQTVIWPKGLEFKDINDMILGEYTENSILEILKENTFKGLDAELRLNDWKKI